MYMVFSKVIDLVGRDKMQEELKEFTVRELRYFGVEW